MADQLSIEFEPQPFMRVTALTREDAELWADPKTCYAVDYVEQADPKKYKFGYKVYRVWVQPPTPELRREWEAA